MTQKSEHYHMLKRVPGVFFDRLFNLPANSTGSGFSSTSGNLPRFRNLDQQFSQILVNGRQVAGIDFGSGQNFLTSIPAESVKEIRVVRSPSAEIDSSGVGMTLDIILKDGGRYSSKTWRAGALSYDGERHGVGSVNFAGSTDSYNYSLGVTYQDRKKGGTRKGDFVTVFGGNFDFLTPGVTDSRTLSDELSTDKNLIGNIGFDVNENGHLKIEGKYFLTDEEASTNSEAIRSGGFTELFDGPGAVEITSDTTDSEKSTENYGLTFSYLYKVDGFSWDAVAGVDEIDFSSTNDTTELGDDGNRFQNKASRASGDGREVLFNNHFLWDVVEGHQLRFGIDLRAISEANSNASDTFGDPSSPFSNSFSTRFSQDSQKTDRADFFAVYEVDLTDTVSIQVGGRYETADYDSSSPARLIIDRDVEDLGFMFDPDILNENVPTPFAASVKGFNPSFHVKWSLAENHDLRFSVAQTVRRPNLSELDPEVDVVYLESRFDPNAPAEIEYGNPDLENEEALGFDIGYDWHFSNGVFGLNFYNRKIQDKIIEREQTLEQFQQLRADVAPEITRFLTFLEDNNFTNRSLIITPENTEADTKARGVELDFSTPLAFISDNAHLYMNATYSREVTTGEAVRRSAAINISYDHLIESIGLTYGFSYNQITKSESEFTSISLGSFRTSRELDPNVEVFIEKRWPGNMLSRLTVENLLDAKDNAISHREDFLGVSDSVTQTDTSPRVLLTLRGEF